MPKSLITSIILVLVGLYSFGDKNPIVNTSWIGTDGYNKMVIEFKDSTCFIYDGNIGKTDTIKARYKLQGDSIYIKPVDEYIVINTCLLKKGDKLFIGEESAFVLKINEVCKQKIAKK